MANKRIKDELHVIELLDKLKKAFDEETFNDTMIQKLEKPQDIKQGIPTLAKGVYRTATPMIEARFKYAGTWENAGLGHTWLSPTDMEKHVTSKAVTRQIKLRQENWEKSAPAQFPPERVSLFGLEAEEQQETYLVWPDRENEEPQVWAYGQYDEHKFKNFVSFVKKLLQD